MLLRKTICKTRFLLKKTLKNFKCFIFGGYQKLPRSLSFNPFLGRSSNSARTYTSDQFYNEFYDILQSDLNRINRNGEISMNVSREKTMEDAASIEKKHVSFVKQISPENGVKEKKDKGNKKNDSCVNELALKMKELEMNDSGDVEQVLDIEEALHYYSRLKSPIYLDIVDKFFTDMHSELSVSQSSVSIKRSKSKGRFGSIRL
ncbi:hypothetical protein MtrunA17_Chr2g0331751 [Medicago truncatula]|uniref:Uncharacterized protein n=1 Tax=Medicago truncatula TaxID=3880 RepID=G7II32_MEDTR|nr:uncharacterized protein LOC11433059 [Medicago truncatula]AES68013.1 hypothetical protein MTR_2g101980 [Medicago truncatula]RHN76405.1 hypothetical protein MtrunA17_Chr2g0331751 [Medicago truncatula]